MTGNNIPTMQEALEIEDSIENVIAEENGDAVFECEFKGHPQSCVWSKDGRPITNCQRRKITSHSKWSRLEIRRINASDHGLYTITCKNSINQISLSANLFVAHRNLNVGVSYTHTTNKESGVIKQLRDVKVVKGNRIELEAKFRLNAVEEYMWFRNNEIVRQNDRVIILNCKKLSTLSILQCELTDSGVYSVVSQTKQGIFSSFANVHVTNVNESLKLNDDDLLPILEEILPDEVETNEGEDTRLICKAIIDLNTDVQWLRNGIDFEKSNFIEEDYGDNYIGLKGVKVSRADKAEYSVVLRDKETGKEDVSTTFLTVNSSPTKNPPVVQLISSLDSAVSSCGSKVIFNCSFALTDPKYFYVVWHVGHYRVERTNSRFSVVCNGGECLLYIKKLELGMAGEVVCELRKSLPNQRSVYVNSSSANITIVPTAFRREISIRKPKLFNDTYPYEEQFNIPENGNLFVKDKTTNGNGLMENYTDKVIIEITYCRLEDEGLYFVHSSRVTSDVNRVLVMDKPRNDGLKNDAIVVVEWDDNIVPTSCWYEILLGQSDSGFILAGVSSLPSFEVEAPPVGRLMRFRIKTTPVVSNVAESKVYIVPTPETVQIAPKNHELQPMTAFELKYSKTDDVVGCGAFGSVVLVQDTYSRYYAAKVIKTRTQKKREAAHREFDIIKKLRHPKLVELIDAYVEKDMFVLVMEYLWGGELLDRIVDEDHIKEVDVVPYVRQICEALQYLHTFKIAHLDVKPENIICLSPNSGQVKIIDFGLAKVLDEGNKVKAIYGTRDYVAPEVLNFEGLSLACDMWSLGVVTYVLLSGMMPFAGETWSQRSANITRASYNYDDTAFHEISDLARNFVDQLLVLKPQNRMSATAALNHTWIIQGPPKGSKAGHMKRTKENLKSYLANYRARWQRAGNVMIAAHRLRTHVGTQRASAEKETTSNGT